MGERSRNAADLDVVGQEAELVGAQVQLHQVLPAGHVERQLLQRIHLQVQLREVPRARENACTPASTAEHMLVLVQLASQHVPHTPERHMHRVASCSTS